MFLNCKENASGATVILEAGTGDSGGRNAPSRSRRQGRAVCVHWSEAKALDGGSGRPRRRLLPGRERREGKTERRMMTEPNNRKGPGSAPGPNPVFSQNGASSDSAVGRFGSSTYATFMQSRESPSFLNICRSIRPASPGGLVDSLSCRITRPKIDSSYSPDFRDGIKWEAEFFMSAPDCLRVRTFGEAVSFSLRDVHVCAQIGPAHLLAGSFESRINFKELGLAYPLGRPTPFGPIMCVDKIFHGSPD